MMCIAFTLALAVFFQRRQRGEERDVPLVVSAVTGLICLGQLRGLFSLLGAVAHVNPADKPTLLAGYLSEALDWRWLLLQLTGLGLAVWVDARVRRHRSREGTPAHAGAPPSGAACQLHVGSAAVMSCARCGGFACEECRSPDGRLCTSCSQRTHQSSSAARGS